jgi:hypothetical protein
VMALYQGGWTNTPPTAPPIPAQSGLWALSIDQAGSFMIAQALNAIPIISACCGSSGSYSVTGSGALSLPLWFGDGPVTGGVGESGTTFVLAQTDDTIETSIAFALPVVAVAPPATLSTVSFSPSGILIDCTGKFSSVADGLAICSPAQTVTLTNHGSDYVYVFGVTVSGDTFALGKTSGCVGSLGPGQSCTVTVAPSDSLKAPRYTQQLQASIIAYVDTIASAQTALSTPLTVSVKLTNSN